MTKHVALNEWVKETGTLRLLFNYHMGKIVPDGLVVQREGWDQLFARFVHLRRNGNRIDVIMDDLAERMGGWVARPKKE